MKKICFILFSLFAFCTQAQRYVGESSNQPARLSKQIPLDTGFIECIYSYKIYDPVRGEERESYQILEVGKNKSKFASYGYYRIDSIIGKDYPNGLTLAQYGNLSAQNNTTPESVVKDLKSGTLQFIGHIFMDFYFYEEPIPEIQWKLTDETQEICGYRCNQATASFRGRTWTAWYSNQIPVNNGPWKFGNLPGLILKIEDENHEHIFEAISIRKSNKGIGLRDLTRIKTTREKFNKALSDYRLHPGDFISGSPAIIKSKNGKHVPNNRMFFNPIEKE